MPSEKKRKMAARKAARVKIARTAAVDPELVFQTAVNWEYTTLLVEQRTMAIIHKATELRADFTLPTAASTLVLSAFCCELYLKCLYASDAGSDPPREHSLKELFELLRPERQKRIRDLYAEALAGPYSQIAANFRTAANDPHAVDFDPMLASASKVFKNWRYIFERPVGAFPPGQSTPAFRGVLRETILELKPEWQHLARVLNPDWFPFRNITGTHPVFPAR
jgi:HEPN domain-containing protein